MFFFRLPADAFCQNRSNIFSCSSGLDMIVFKKERRIEQGRFFSLKLTVLSAILQNKMLKKRNWYSEN